MRRKTEAIERMKSSSGLVFMAQNKRLIAASIATNRRRNLATSAAEGKPL
jgi:hypothetical protein